MKVLLINGSPHAKGNTYVALHEMEKSLLRKISKLKSYISAIKTFAAVSHAVPVCKRANAYLTMR